MAENKPRILLIDIETSPIVGYSWDMFDARILGVIEPLKVLCAAWKWLDEKDISVSALCDFNDYVDNVVDDASLVSSIWGLLDQADVVIAHNGASFDVKILNARFIAHNLIPPSDYKTVDTLKVAKKYFRFLSNALDGLGEYLQEGRKASTGGFQLWLDCMKGDKRAWARMKKYNAQDVKLLERIYLRLRPFMIDHPNLNLIKSPKIGIDKFACSTCQSINTQKRGRAITKAGSYQRYQCGDCGSWSSGPYQRNKINLVEHDEIEEV